MEDGTMREEGSNFMSVLRMHVVTDYSIVEAGMNAMKSCDEQKTQFPRFFFFLGGGLHTKNLLPLQNCTTLFRGRRHRRKAPFRARRAPLMARGTPYLLRMASS